ncbi:MAG: hypothetical protein HY538_07140 [Deltaproteobacteria bacterium]|nr:hypothetical protein [Deltaproteobacteria bacterium]
MSLFIPEKVAQGFEKLQRSIERIYDVEEVPQITRYLLNEETLRRFSKDIKEGVYLLEEEGKAQVGVFFKSERFEAFEQISPLKVLDRENLEDFLTVIEEISHFVYLLWSLRKRRPVSQLSLELQGEVDKYLTTVFHLAVQNKGRFPAKVFQQLFAEPQWIEGLDGEALKRYEFANKLAYRYCVYLEEEFLRCADLPALLQELRRFYRRDFQSKLSRILH